ncbi:hypothetical protein CPTSV76_122 [Enterobacteria phage SV76]|nr:hypothetical protein CPTSV76_122 [Enterobacteria phage SV76]
MRSFPQIQLSIESVGSSSHEAAVLNSSPKRYFNASFPKPNTDSYVPYKRFSSTKTPGVSS